MVIDYNGILDQTKYRQKKYYNDTKLVMSLMYLELSK